jgi:hypothetical protein
VNKTKVLAMPYSSFQPFHKLERQQAMHYITTSERNYMGEENEISLPCVES